MVTAEMLKRWGCREWSDDERAELARIANELGLTAPAAGKAGMWPELAAAFSRHMA